MLNIKSQIPNSKIPVTSIVNQTSYIQHLKSNIVHRKSNIVNQKDEQELAPLGNIYQK